MAKRARTADHPFEGQVEAGPVKSFFVEMLTRDLLLEDAILDLLDNCIDGINRSLSKADRKADRPYDGYEAEISFSKSGFKIADNCGGIPWRLHNYAFQLGRPKGVKNDTPGTVGIYGIGMKRAIFKLGKQSEVKTQHDGDRWWVRINPDWMDDEVWKLPVTKVRAKPTQPDGTSIEVTDLREDVAKRFEPGRGREAFEAGLRRMIETHYSLIIEKGFRVKVNGKAVVPRPVNLIFSREPRRGIKPYIYRASHGGVDIFLMVGFTRALPTEQEISAEQERKRFSTADAGWTVVCNDRIVLYCDKSELTGWGTAGVPRYHTQFTAISGIVEFRATDASKLPTTTTKRGINASSLLYLQVREKMAQGLKIFTDFTNAWKTEARAAQRLTKDERTVSLSEAKKLQDRIRFVTLNRGLDGAQQFRPKLPKPTSKERDEVRVVFSRSKSEVEAVSTYLFDRAHVSASRVGERCFEIVLEDAQ